MDDAGGQAAPLPRRPDGSHSYSVITHFLPDGLLSLAGKLAPQVLGWPQLSLFRSHPEIYRARGYALYKYAIIARFLDGCAQISTHVAVSPGSGYGRLGSQGAAASQRHSAATEQSWNQCQDVGLTQWVNPRWLVFINKSGGQASAAQKIMVDVLPRSFNCDMACGQVHQEDFIPEGSAHLGYLNSHTIGDLESEFAYPLHYKRYAQLMGPLR
jgi:hypothetical protein